jgi:hypothetical protein
MPQRCRLTDRQRSVRTVLSASRRRRLVRLLEAGDKVKALEAEAKVKDQAIADLKSALADMRVKYAEAAGENTILKQRAVSDLALIDLFSKQVRPKSFIKIF